MIWYLLAAAIVIIFFAHFTIREGWDSVMEAVAATAAHILIFGLLATLAFVISSVILTVTVEPEYKLCYTEPLVEMSDGVYIDIRGEDNELQYCYFVETEQGAQLQSSPYYKVRLVLSDEETPRVETLEPEWTSRNVYIWGVPLDAFVKRIYVPEDALTGFGEIAPVIQEG